MSNQLHKSPALIYLAAVPFITAAVGFGIGGFSNMINIPLWIAHSLLMILLFSKRTAHLQTEKPGQDKQWRKAIFLLFLPWVLFTLFAGFGPPPATAEAWVHSALQQQVRYTILAIGGIISAAGFRMLAQQLKHYPGNHLAKAGLRSVMIATPLHVLNMLYWGFFLTASFRYFVGQHITERPQWYLTARDIFYWIDSIALVLLYLSAALFAASLKKAGIFKPGPANVYLGISAFGIICSLLPPGVPAPLDVIAYLVAVPAISFILPYLMSLNLAARHSSDPATRNHQD
jgi:hypothetical protein